MRTLVNGILAGFLMLASTVVSTVPGEASAFFGWRVVGVPAWDTLNVRAYPHAQSRILVAYPNGTMLSLTGRCTGGVNLNYIGGWPAWKQRQAVRAVWCETWVDPYGSGHYRSGWVYGKYIAPA
jgi:G:T/U-mismatch repair DNA glycosylase